mgnify:FL=1
MSEIKVNKISPRTNCGTVTLGDSGDTITIPSGVTITNNGTQTGFGRTGTVDWQTGSIKTADFTASNGEGYFVNTTSGAVTVTLPSSPSAGSIVAIADYAGTAATNAITIGRNSSPFEGATVNGQIIINRQVVTLVYVDGTQGWIPVGENDSSFQTPSYIAASGGNTTLTCGDFKIHVFTGPGTFTVSCAGNSAGSNTVSYVVVAGGGGAGFYYGAGGAGGYREGKATSDTYTASPLGATTGLPVSATGYPITVGGGGAGSPPSPGLGTNGSNSIFSSITSAGGGAGIGVSGPSCAAGSGGSGGSAGYSSNAVGSGNTPPVSPPQGNNGGAAAPTGGGGGGGGAGAVGQNAPGASQPGDGGDGVAIGTDFFGPTSGSYGTPGPSAGRWFAGGGSGANCGTSSTNPGGAGGGGTGRGPLSTWSANAGTTNTGGGAGGGGGPYGRSAGGSGIVMIRYKFQ